MRHARKWMVLAAALAAAPALGATVELEVGAGSSGREDLGPSFTGRVGLDFFNWLTPSLRVLAVPKGGPGADLWALVAELRAHTRGRIQLTGGLGLGVGQALVDEVAGAGVQARVARTVPYLVGDAGVRVTLWTFWLGLGVAHTPFTPDWSARLTLGWAPLETRRG